MSMARKEEAVPLMEEGIYKLMRMSVMVVWKLGSREENMRRLDSAWGLVEASERV